MALHRCNPSCWTGPFQRTGQKNYSVLLRTFPLLAIRQLQRLLELFIMVHWVEVLGKIRLREEGENRNPNSPCQRGKCSQFNFLQLVSFFCCQKHVFKNSNRCEQRGPGWTNRVSCQREYALVANEKSRYWLLLWRHRMYWHKQWRETENSWCECFMLMCVGDGRGPWLCGTWKVIWYEIAAIHWQLFPSWFRDDSLFPWNHAEIPRVPSINYMGGEEEIFNPELCAKAEPT